jgi:MerR family copper efflux transcriptional regulator
LAREAGVRVDTVRHYEQAGLLVPDHRRPSGVRRYGPPALKRLRFIRRARALGLSLETIGNLLTLVSAHVPTRGDRIARHVADLDARLAALTHLRQALVTLAATPPDGLDSDDAILEALTQDTLG